MAHLLPTPTNAARFLGGNFVEAMCDKFIEEDRWLKNFAYELPTVRSLEKSSSARPSNLTSPQLISPPSPLTPHPSPLPQCPCMQWQAKVDRGRYAPDFECDEDGNAHCFFHQVL